MFQSILFDLDGTLTDTAPGITNSVKYALSKFGIHETDDKKAQKIFGASAYIIFYGILRIFKRKGAKGG